MKDYKPADPSTQTQNRWGDGVPAIPEPYHHMFRKECYVEGCHEKFWSDESYRGHFALRHIAGL